MQGSTAYILALQEAEELVASALSGIVSHSVDDVNKTITFTFADSTSATLTFSQPSDGNGITSTTLDSNYHFILTYDNGNTEDAGAVPYQTAARIDKTTNHLILELTDGTEIDAGELPTGTMDTSKYLAKDNTTAFTPTGDYNPATKKYVDDITGDTSTLTVSASNLTDAANKLDAKIGDLTTLTVTGVSDLVSAINKLDASFMSSITYNSKKLTIAYKNGSTQDIDISSIITDTNIEELSNVVVSSIQNGDVLMYDTASNKFVNKQVSTTDEKVKMSSGDSSGDYLENLIDGTTVVNDNGKLVAKTLDGQTITIAELNTLKGIKGNVQATLDLISSGNLKVINTPFGTYADLTAFDFSTLTEDMSYIAYVLVDETRDNAKTSYIVDKDGNINFFGVTTISTRDFSTDPIDLTSEVTGKLPKENIDVDDVLEQLTTSKEYKTLTTSEEVFNTHGANEMYNELVGDLSDKVNTDDIVDNLTSEATDKTLSAKQGKELKSQVDNAVSYFTTHTDNTDIHVTKTDKEKWDKVEDIEKELGTATLETTAQTIKEAINETYEEATSGIKTYTDISELGLESATTYQVFEAMPNYSSGVFSVRKNGSNIITDLPETSCNGVLMIDKRDNVSFSVMFKRSNSTSFDNYLAIAHFAGSDGSDFKWEKVAKETQHNITEYKVNIDESADIEKLGITDYSTITNLLDFTKNLSTNKRLVIQVNSASKTILYDNGLIPVKDAGLLIITFQSIRGSAYYTTDGGLMYVSTTSNANNTEWSSWKRVCTTTVEDVAKTTFSQTSGTSNYTTDSAYTSYIVENGWCNVTLKLTCVANSTTWVAVGVLPKPKQIQFLDIAGFENTSVTTLCLQLNVNGSLAFAYGQTGKSYNVSFTYPVA